jgi:hypothetical protein
MEMPENCALCPMWYAGNCLTATEAIICEYDKRPQDCPLVQVPPHGRLIDAGELRELYEEWENDKEAGIDIDKCHVPVPVIRQNIDDAPTVIPAEEKEDG